MAQSVISLQEFEVLLPRLCDAMTSSDANGWKAENPLYAHCAVVALLAQDIFRGELLRASLSAFPEFAHMRSHYWNLLPNGVEIDFTAPQFLGRRPELHGELRARSAVLSPEYPETRRRYEILRQRFSRHTHFVL